MVQNAVKSKEKPHWTWHPMLNLSSCIFVTNTAATSSWWCYTPVPTEGELLTMDSLSTSMFIQQQCLGLPNVHKEGLRNHGAQHKKSLQGISCFEKTCCFHSCCILTGETGWYILKKYTYIYNIKIIIINIYIILDRYICIPVPHLCCTHTQFWALENTFNCHRVFRLKSFISLICMELKSKAPSEQEGHLNPCQELTAHCTQLLLTIFHRWGLLHCRLSPNSLFSSVHVWHVENSSSEQPLVSACECGLSGSQTPMPLQPQNASLWNLSSCCQQNYSWSTIPCKTGKSMGI